MVKYTQCSDIRSQSMASEGTEFPDTYSGTRDQLSVENVTAGSASDLDPGIPIKRPAGNVDVDEPSSKKPMSCDREQSEEMSEVEWQEEKCECEPRVNRIREDEELQLIDHQECTLHRLPAEIVDMIFTYFSARDRKTVRLVCKAWYNKCNRNEDISLRLTKVSAMRLGNCGLTHMNLSVQHSRLDKFLPVWNNIGSRIYSLELYHCQLGNEVMEKVIVQCDNLQRLSLALHFGKVEDVFCSPEMLEKLIVRRKRLETFEIDANTRFSSSTDGNYDVWLRIFNAFFRIFPNVIHFASGRHCLTWPAAYYSERFRCSFSKQSGESDEDGLFSCLAWSLSREIENWRIALDALSMQRLKDFSLCVWKTTYTQEDCIALHDFFVNHKELESVEIVFRHSICKEMLKSVFLNIINNCSELQRLKFCKKLLYQDNDWLLTLKKKELTLLRERTLKFKKVAIGGLTIEGPVMSLQTFCDSGQSSLSLVQTYVHLQRLNIKNHVSDDTLQNIFRYLTNLTSLKISLGMKNTSFGLTGRRVDDSGNTVIGYSISRLRNLEQLVIGVYTSLPDETFDGIFNEFDFPKLRTFSSCISPNNPSILGDVGRKLPSLVEIAFSFSEKISSDALMDFSQHTKYLRVICVRRSQLSSSDAKKVFGICPTLRFLYSSYVTYFYDPFCEKVLSRKLSNDSISFR